MDVGALAPGDTIVIDIQYTCMVTTEGAAYCLVLPTAIGPRYSVSGNNSHTPLPPERKRERERREGRVREREGRARGVGE